MNCICTIISFQVWHQCFADRTWAFLCPNGTIFNQEIFTCVWWFDFDCSTAESFYSLNADLYSGPTGGSNGDGGATGNGGGDAGSDATSGLAPEVVETKVYREYKFFYQKPRYKSNLWLYSTFFGPF